MNDFEAIQKMLENAGKASELMDLASSPDAKRIEHLVDKEALEAAMKKGDMQAMQGMIRGILNTSEGKALADKLSGMMNK